MHIIYLIEREDGLRYVGQTVNINGRLNAHKKSQRFEKYGIKRFTQIDYAENIEEACEKERYWIDYYDTFDNGLNMTRSGGYNHKSDSIKFSTLSMSYTKGTKWYNNGEINIRVQEGKEPCGFVKGKITRNPRKSLSEDARKKMSKTKKGKVSKVKFEEDVIREIFLLYKSRPQLENVGEYTDAAKTRVLSYERAFAKKYSKRFNMTSNNLYKILLQKGGVARKHLWNEIIGDEEINVVTNTKNTRYNLQEKEIRDIFTFIKDGIETAEKDLKDVIEDASTKFNIRKNYIHKLYATRGGKKWREVWDEIIGDVKDSKRYIRNATITEEKVKNFFRDFLLFSGSKKQFCKKSREYGLSEHQGRKLLYSKDKGRWKYIWEHINETRNTN